MARAQVCRDRRRSSLHGGARQGHRRSIVATIISVIIGARNQD